MLNNTKLRHFWARIVSWAPRHARKTFIVLAPGCSWLQPVSILLLRTFPYLGSAHQVFNLHVLQSYASSIFTYFSFMSFLITSLHLSFGLPIILCPPTSIFHVLITTSSSVFLSTWPNHLSLASIIFSLMFATPALALISSFLIFTNHPSQHSHLCYF